jgi:hypothetical protein
VEDVAEADAVAALGGGGAADEGRAAEVAEDGLEAQGGGVVGSG